MRVTKKTGFYICNTCKKTMMNCKIPSMSVVNGLNLTNIEEGCHLTELENNLIAQNINFQYIFSLKKSRWAATKKQMISVPVAPEVVLKTLKRLPRIPREAGLVPVKIKRKLEYEGHHKNELVAPIKCNTKPQNIRSSILPRYLR